MESGSSPLVLITGGSCGLGRAAALALAKTGSDVILTGNRQGDEATRVVETITAMGRRAAALLPLIADGGRILNVSSGLARFTVPGSSAYAMKKGAVEVFTRYLAKELGSRGITANTLAPGAIMTNFSGGTVRDNPEVNAYVSLVTALGRSGKPYDIGPIVAALLGPGTCWINGERIEASGGMAL